MLVSLEKVRGFSGVYLSWFFRPDEFEVRELRVFLFEVQRGPKDADPHF